MKNNLGKQKLSSLAELFSKDNIFRIPIYQRGYAWEDKQVDDLWDDIMNLYNLSVSSNRNVKQKHYTGLLVLEEIGSENENDISRENLEGLDGFYIVDGQQRITSLVIILCCICHHKKENLDEHLTYGQIKRFGYSLLRNDGARDYFEKRVYENDNSILPSDLYQNNILNLCKRIDKKLSELNDNQIDAIKDIILNDMAFNVFTVSKEFDVRLTFETMNNRGKNLTHLELLKNRLMYLANFFDDSKTSKPKSDLIREIDSAWGIIYQEFGKSTVPLSDDEFLKAHWSLIKTLDKRNNNGYIDDIFKKCFTVEKINEQKKSEGDDVVYKRLIPYVKDLSNFAKYWVFVNRPYDTGVGDKLNLNSKDRYWISRISRISSHHHIMTALAALTSKVSYIKTIDERVEFYKTFEKLLFINVHLSTTKRNDMSTLVTNIRDLYLCDIKDEDALDSYFVLFKTQVFKNTDAIRVEKNRVQNILKNQFIRYSTGELDFYNWRGLKYFFYAYEDAKTPDSQPTFDWSDFDVPSSIEHIYPQNPSEDSPGHEYWKKGFEKFYENLTVEDKEKERQLITNVIGNLGLATNCASNSSLSNHIYPIKSGHKEASKETKEQLQESYKYDRLNLKLVSETYEQWTPGTIIDRTRTLLTFIKDTWLNDYFLQDGEDIPEDNSKFPVSYWEKYLDDFIGNILQYRPKHSYRESKNLFGMLQKLVNRKNAIDKSFNAETAKSNPAKNASKSDKQLYKCFWADFNEYIKKDNSYLFKEQSLSRSYYDCDILPTIFSKCHLTLEYNRKDGLLRVMIYIPNSKKLYDELKSHKAKIESEMGYKLIWDRHKDEERESTIYIECGDYKENIENNNFNEAFSWLIETGKKFYDVFSEYLLKTKVPKVLKTEVKQAN